MKSDDQEQFSESFDIYIHLPFSFDLLESLQNARSCPPTGKKNLPNRWLASQSDGNEIRLNALFRGWRAFLEKRRYSGVNGRVQQGRGYKLDRIRANYAPHRLNGTAKLPSGNFLPTYRPAFVFPRPPPREVRWESSRMQ